MDGEILESEENETKMFVGKKGQLTADEELALHIMHRFNIDRETLDSMPAFDQHKKMLFREDIEK